MIKLQDVRKGGFLTRPAPARQDAPLLGQGRSEREGQGVHRFYVPKGITVERSSSNENTAGGLFQHPVRVVGAFATRRTQ